MKRTLAAALAACVAVAFAGCGTFNTENARIGICRALQLLQNRGGMVLLPTLVPRESHIHNLRTNTARRPKRLGERCRKLFQDVEPRRSA